MAEDKIIKPPGPDEGPKGISVTSGAGGIKITGKTRLHSALAQVPAESPEESFRKAAADARGQNPDSKRDPLTATNRIAIMADVSGSMSEHAGASRKIDHLKNALTGFNNQVNFDTTSVAIYTFPLGGEEVHQIDHLSDDGISSDYGHGVSHKLSFDKFLLDVTIQGLSPRGGTPMDRTMAKVLEDISLTRGIIISDGEADSSERAIEQARQYAASETIIDTVHIGDSYGGESLLKEIAATTGGIYIKFSDVSSFAKSFAYLTPEGRAVLMLSGDTAKMIGAREVIK